MKCFLLIATLALISACSTLPMGVRQQMQVGGDSISYIRNDKPSPTVVFEAGAGDDLTVWGEVYDQVSLHVGTFAYSRPGYSNAFQLSRSSKVRTADEVALGLRAALDKAAIPAPYVLVGHSVGGLYVLEFARDYPDLVAGLVLVDARLPGFTERCETESPGPCLPPDIALLLSPPHIAAEVRGITPSEAVAPTARDIGNIPTIVLAATEPPRGGSAQTQPVWLEVQKEFANDLSVGKLVIANGSGHHIQHDAPELVVDAILELVGNATIPAGQ